MAAESSSAVTQPKQQKQHREDTTVAAIISKNLVEPVKRAATSRATKQAILTSAVLAATVAASVTVAVIAYAVLYQVYVPKPGFKRDVELQFGYGRPPFASIDLAKESFATDLAYDVILELVVPATSKNIDLGNFMVDLDMQAADGRSLIKTAKAATLTWAPLLVRHVQTLIRLPLYLFTSYKPGTQFLEIPLVSSGVLRTFSSPKMAAAHVSLGRQDAYSANVCSAAGLGELQVYRAILVVRAHLHGIRWFMYSHRILSFLIFSTIFFTITISSSLLVWALITFFRPSSRPSSSSSASFPQITIEPLSPHAQLESIDAKHSENASAREQEWADLQRKGGRRMYAAEHEGESLLGHIKVGSSDDDEGGDGGKRTTVKEESSEDEGSAGWQDVNEEEKILGQIKVEPEDEKDNLDDETQTLGGSATSAGETISSRRSFGPSTTTATSVSGDSLRRRPSSLSMRG